MFINPLKMLSEAFQIIQLNQKLSVFTVKNKVHIEAKKKKKKTTEGAMC